MYRGAGDDCSLHGRVDADAVRHGDGHGHGGPQARLRQHAHVRVFPVPVDIPSVCQRCLNNMPRCVGPTA